MRIQSQTGASLSPVSRGQFSLGTLLAHLEEEQPGTRPLSVLRSGSTRSSYCDELAFWFLTCRLFTTCFTLGTLVATFSARSRLYREFTSPVSVTTPFFTSYFTLSCILFWISAASRFFSTPVSRSEFTAFASFSTPTGITAI